MTTRNVLNQWKIIHAQAPENGMEVVCIEGQVASSNPRFPHSSTIRTSYLTAYELDACAFVVITSRRSEYVLGTRHPAEYLSEEYLKYFLPERADAQYFPAKALALGAQAPDRLQPSPPVALANQARQQYVPANQSRYAAALAG